MAGPSRSDTSFLGRWWWSLDHLTLASVCILLGFSFVLVMAASPAVALRIGDARNYLIIKQVIFICLALAVVPVASMLSTEDIKKLGFVVFGVSFLLTALTVVHGVDIKGARRWLYFGGFFLQPGEGLNPGFAIVTAWLLVERKKRPGFPGLGIALGFWAVILLFLKEQPDVGLAFLITFVFFIQLVIDGLSPKKIWISLGGMGVLGALFYALFAHVRARVQEFLHPTFRTAYQVLTSLEAFGNGGLWGRGPGEGVVKNFLPSAHADFILAVAGEEYGLFVCLFIVGVYGFIILRGFARILAKDDPFVLLTGVGLLSSFGLQTVINMASALELMPDKGTTLPMISYGGSSLLASALMLGIVLALTRRQVKGGRI